jgi:hypothetical protein
MVLKLDSWELHLKQQEEIEKATFIEHKEWPAKNNLIDEVSKSGVATIDQLNHSMKDPKEETVIKGGTNNGINERKK